MPRRRTIHVTPRDLSVVREIGGKTEELLKVIRVLALKQQRNGPQLFLSVRDSSSRFGVPVSTMAEIYARLRREKILGTVRGFRTVLLGRSTTRKITVAGVVDLPVSVPRLQTLSYYRDCFIHVRQQLHSAGFIVTPNYSERREIETFEALARIAQEKPDAMIWVLPDGAERDLAPRVQDLGIKFVGLNTDAPGYQFSRYEVSRTSAVQTILRRWRSEQQLDQVKVICARPETRAESKRNQRLRRTIEAEDMGCEIFIPDWRRGGIAEQLCGGGRAGLLLLGPAAAMLGWRGSETVAETFGACRVALVDGPIDLPLADYIPAAVADVIVVNWSKVAKRVVEDLVSGKDDANIDGPIVFEAVPKFRVPLSQCGRRL